MQDYKKSNFCFLSTVLIFDLVQFLAPFFNCPNYSLIIANCYSWGHKQAMAAQQQKKS
jgi:hypothetical protein